MTDKKQDKKTKAQKKEADKLAKQVDELSREKEELFSQLQRVSADYANFQKRVPKQINDRVSYEREKILKSFIPALDNFEHTLAGAESIDKSEDLIKGIRIVYDQMQEILKSHGVEQVEAVGQKFDPAFHEAMMRREDAEKEDDEILEEFQKGYRIGERVLRASRVIVNKLPVEEPEAETEEAEVEEETGETEE
jgi:molecular chaperone GrpE